MMKNDWTIPYLAMLGAFAIQPRHRDEIEAHLGLDWNQTNTVIHEYRMRMSNTSALIQFWNGSESFYHITDDPKQIRQWCAMKLRDGDTRLTTIYTVAQVMVTVTSGRTVAGQRARAFVKHVGRLHEDIEDILAMHRAQVEVGA